MEKVTRFDDYTSVDCNECEHYWTSACDGASPNKERICYAYKVTRIVDLEKIKKNQRSLTKILLLTNVTLLVHLLTHLIEVIGVIGVIGG